MFKQLKALSLLVTASTILAGCTPQPNDAAASLKLYTFDCGKACLIWPYTCS